MLTGREAVVRVSDILRFDRVFARFFPDCSKSHRSSEEQSKHAQGEERDTIRN